MQQLVAGAALFEVYQSKLKLKRRYDYEDMISWVLRAFQDHPYLLRLYQEQYHYFLVDEFQDTNAVQFELLQQLMAFWPIPNVFIVGDDDQSIFEFQGARIQNLLHFYAKYESSLKLVVLKENYRSGQIILDAAHQLILQNTSRLLNQWPEVPVTKKLHAQPTTNDLPIIKVDYPNAFHEVVDLVDQFGAVASGRGALSRDGRDLCQA